MSLADRFLKVNDQIVEALERDYERPADVAEEGAVTRIDYRAEGWLFCLIVGANFFLMCLLSLFSGVLGGLPLWSLLASLWPTVAVTAVLLVLSATLYSTKNGLIVSSTEIWVKQGIYPFHKMTRIPMQSVRSVRTGYFRFANWDRYVVLETDTQTYRVAWGLSEQKSEAVAKVIRQYASRAA